MLEGCARYEKPDYRQAYVEPTSAQDELLRWKHAHWEEAQTRSSPRRGDVNPSDVEKARLVWQEAQIPKSKPLTDPQVMRNWQSVAEGGRVVPNGLAGTTAATRKNS